MLRSYYDINGRQYDRAAATPAAQSADELGERAPARSSIRHETGSDRRVIW